MCVRARKDWKGKNIHFISIFPFHHTTGVNSPAGGDERASGKLSPSPLTEFPEARILQFQLLIVAHTWVEGKVGEFFIHFLPRGK